MANRREILNHWQRKFKWQLRTDVCWGCSIVCETQRCHIHAMQHGGHDHPSNLVLLCRRCHQLQEMACSTEVGRFNFVNKMVRGLLFYPARKAELDVVRNLMELDAEREEVIEDSPKEARRTLDDEVRVSAEASQHEDNDQTDLVLRLREVMMKANGGRAPGYQALRAWMEEHGHKAPSFHRIRTIYKAKGLFVNH